MKSLDDRYLEEQNQVLYFQFLTNETPLLL